MFRLLAQAEVDGYVSSLKEILEGGVPLILAVMLVITCVIVYKLARANNELQKQLREKIQELLEKQLEQQGPLTKALTHTTEALKKTETTIEKNSKKLEDNTLILADVKAQLKKD